LLDDRGDSIKQEGGEGNTSSKIEKYSCGFLPVANGILKNG